MPRGAARRDLKHGILQVVFSRPLESCNLQFPPPPLVSSGGGGVLAPNLGCVFVQLYRMTREEKRGIFSGPYLKHVDCSKRVPVLQKCKLP